MNKKYTTILLSVFLGLFLMSGFWYFNSRGQGELSAQEVAQKAVDYLNDNLLPEDLSASLISAVEKTDIIEISFEISGQEYDSYVTKSGNLFFVEGIDLNEGLVDIGDEVQQEVTKSERPDVHFFVMSYCPYGLQAQKVFLPVYELLGDKADIEVNFLNYVMHEKKEIDENLRQYCIQEEQTDKYSEYLGCFVEGGESESCLVSSGINKDEMNNCIAVTDESYNVYSQYEDKSTWLGGVYPKFDVELGLNEQYGVEGSPALIINGSIIVSVQKDCPAGKECVVISDITRTPEKFKDIICQAFIEQPEECSQTLSSDGFNPGFGLEQTDDSSDASCQ